MTGQELRKTAVQLLGTIRTQARRAFILELTGTPKAGKTTSVTVVQSFFKECGYSVELLHERAAECPLLMKGHFFFNTWTFGTMLSQVLATLDSRADLVILDRGFFDALVWLELQQIRGQVSADEKRVFADFVMLPRWRSLVDLTIVMSANPGLAMERENQNLVIPRTGSMMKPDSLQDFNRAMEEAKTAYGEQFALMDFSTKEGDSIQATNTSLVGQILPRIEAWADPEILVVPRKLVVELLGGRSAHIAGDKLRELWERLRNDVRPMRRSQSKSDETVVQLVAGGIHRDPDGRVLVLRRADADEKTEQYGKFTVWKGRHIQKTDFQGPMLPHVPEDAWAGLRPRIEGDLHLHSTERPQCLGLVWDQDSGPHLGLLFEIPVRDPDVVRSLEKEFRKGGRSYSLRGEFLGRAEALERAGIEPWSRMALEEFVK